SGSRRWKSMGRSELPGSGGSVGRRKRTRMVAPLERDDFSSNHHLAPTYSWSMILFRKPVATFRDHALCHFGRNELFGRFLLLDAAEHAITNRARRIAAPGGAGVHDLALHQIGVHVEHDVVAHGHAVMRERSGAQRAALAELDAIGLEHAFLER